MWAIAGGSRWRLRYKVRFEAKLYAGRVPFYAVSNAPAKTLVCAPNARVRVACDVMAMSLSCHVTYHPARALSR